MSTLAPERELRVPRELVVARAPSDRIFRSTISVVGMFVLVVTASIGLFLGYQGIPTLRHYGLSFFTQTNWQPELNQIGIAAVAVGTIEVALIALVLSFPLSIGFALFITEYSPRRIRAGLISAVDLMAAVPGLIYGLWVFFLLQPRAIGVARFLSQYLGWLPIFRVGTDANAPVWQQSRYTGSAFIAGLAVSMMVIPLATSIMRSVFDQAPAGEREAGLALGGTRAGVIRTVVLPYAKGGVIGAAMLALGRALGETAAVLIVISPAYVIKSRVLESGVQTFSGLIAGNFGNATHAQLSALLTAGFILFLLTLAVNTVAARFIKRSRSGASTEL